ncbi:MAG: hypothetical protein M3O91_10255, partial [Chloroflexota bacterium]|nr:hypothetical protein [Chloroflexota bacterium]
MAGPTFLGDTGAFAFDATGIWALRAWNYDTQREELVSIEGRVLYFENRRRLDEFFGYLYGQGGDPRDIPLGQAVARSLTPIPYRPQEGD